MEDQVATPSGIGLIDAGKNTLEVFAVMDTTKGKDLSAGIFERGSTVEEFFIVKNEETVVEDPGIPQSQGSVLFFKSINLLLRQV